MKSISSIIYSIFLLILSTALYATDSQGDARYLNITKAYTLNKDGSIQFEYKHSLRFDSYFAIHRKYGETNVLYDPEYQKVKVNYAYTDNEGRDRLPIPENALVEILPYMAQNAPFYNHLRQLIIVHTGLRIGSVASVNYTLNSNAEFMKFFAGNERILESSPADEKIIIIRVPNDKELFFKLHNASVEPQINKSEDFTEYIWIFKNLDAYQHEAMQQHPSFFEPWLQFSTTSMKNMYYSAMSHQAFRFNLSPPMEKWVDKIYEESMDVLDFVLQLQRKVVNDFRTYNIPLQSNAYRLQTAEEVFINGGGTPLEKAFFLVACLQRRGIRAFPVAATTSALVNENIGDLSVFDQFLVRLHTLPEEFVYLPVDKIPHNNLRFSLQNHILLPFYTGVNIFELKKEKASVNNIHVIANIELFENKGKKSLVNIAAKNNAVPFYVMRGKMDEEVNRFFNTLRTRDEEEGEKNIFCKINPVKHKRNKILDFTQNTFKADLKMISTATALKHQEPYYFYTLPHSNYGIADLRLPVLYPQRRSVFILPATISETYDYQIRIPKGYQFENTDLNKSLSFDFGEISIEIKAKKRKLNVTKSLVLKETEIALKDYSDFIQMLTLWNSQEASTIIIKKH